MTGCFSILGWVLAAAHVLKFRIMGWATATTVTVVSGSKRERSSSGDLPGTPVTQWQEMEEF